MTQPASVRKTVTVVFEAALRAALATRDAVRAAGLEIRAGVHTGEVEVRESDIRGIQVHAVARIMSAAHAGSILTAAVTRALAAASDIRFESTGVHTLKGFDQPVELFEMETTR